MKDSGSTNILYTKNIDINKLELMISLIIS